MCGVFGEVNVDDVADFEPRANRTIFSLRHRGPDDFGVWESRMGDVFAGLGQTRLSVIDLSDGGHQPMVSADGRFVLVFNGEIYNYRELRSTLEGHGCVFRTSSDTEVLLQAWATWGSKCLESLIGMFAFAVLDTRDRSLTCVRDAFGIKPLFFHATSSSFAFASEITALESLLERKFGINESSMMSYLAFGSYDMGSETFFRDVSRLEAGHMVRLKLEGRILHPEISRWWWPSVNEEKTSFANAAEMVRGTFLNNIRLHLRSDVQLGVALSGGVDSSSIACAVRHLESDMPIKTFSFVAPGSSVSEELWVDRVNAHVGAEPHKVIVAPSELASDLDDMIRVQGEPFGSTSIYAQYRVYRAAREAGVTVMLDGQGADELFAGYSGYPEARIRSLLAQGNLLGVAGLLRRWSQYPGRSKGLALQHLGSVLTPGALKPWARRLVGKGVVSELFEPGVLESLDRKNELRFQAKGDVSGARILAAELRFALTGGPLNVLLRHGDRNSMRWSIESRVPFLSIPMAQLALSLPESYLLSSAGETKRILRAALSGVVPGEILGRRDKVGFQTPEHDWLKSLGTQSGEWLDGLSLISGINVDAARAHAEDSLLGKRHYSWQTWRLMNAGRWAKIFIA